MAFLAGTKRLVAAVLLAAAAAPPALGAQGLEYEVKAAFVFNFIQFVQWPPSMSQISAPFHVCLYVDNPFGQALQRTVQGEQVNGRSIEVEIVAVDAPLTQCHVLFVPQSQSDIEGVAVLAASRGPMLTIGESPDFLKAGGMINLFVDQGRVRFDVNLAAAEAQGLGLSSRLLRVARSTSEGGNR
jgi:hypothetical protein